MNNTTSSCGAGTSRVAISGVAYSGGTLKLPGWQYPVVVDLAGMKIPGEIPLLADHDNTTTSRLGLVEARITDNAVMISGGIVSASPEAEGIVGQGKTGADWQLSIGADVNKFRLARETQTVNGRAFEPPFYVISESTLREVSVVAVGADAHTNMKVAARFHFIGETPESSSPASGTSSESADSAGNTPGFSSARGIRASNNINQPTERIHDSMNTSNNDTVNNASDNFGQGAAASDIAPITAVARERERVRAIHTICNGEFDEIETQAIADGTSPETVAARVLSAIRAGRPGANLGIIMKAKPEGASARSALEATLALRAGIDPEELVKSCGERAVEAGMADIGMSMKEIMIECLRADGIEAGRSFDNETIRSAFSSVTLPGILSNVANKKLLQSFRAQPVIATQLCTGADLSDFKEHDHFRLTDVGNLELIPQDGQFKNSGLTEENAKNQLETYGKKFCLTRKMIINDDLGAFMKVPALMGNRAARLIDQLFFKRLLSNPKQSDGNPLFTTSHKNFLNGSSSALSATSLTQGIRNFLSQTDSDSQPICVEPRYLLVPPDLKHTAIELTKSATLIMSGTDNKIRPSLNVIADENLRVLCSPYLNCKGYDGGSATAWYLFADPQIAETWEIGYLRGRRTPTVERGETDFNTLGIWFRVYFDLGIREQDYRGMFKATGVA